MYKIDYSFLKLLAAKGNCKIITIFSYDVTYSDGSQVPIEYMFELFPGAKHYSL